MQLLEKKKAVPRPKHEVAKMDAIYFNAGEKGIQR